MINHLAFTLTIDQWGKIKVVVFDRLGRDADQIELARTTGNSRTMTSLRRCIETAALLHILRSASESQTPGHKARIKQLNAMRDRADALRADIIGAIAPGFTIKNIHYRPLTNDTDSLDRTEHAIATLVDVIDSSIAAQRPQQIANTRKAGRDHFWNEMLTIWISIGGASTGIAAAEFLVRTSQPVFERVHAIGGNKTAASMPQDYEAVTEWLRLRAKSQAATP